MRCTKACSEKIRYGTYAPLHLQIGVIIGCRICYRGLAPRVALGRGIHCNLVLWNLVAPALHVHIRRCIRWGWSWRGWRWGIRPIIDDYNHVLVAAALATAAASHLSLGAAMIYGVGCVNRPGGLKCKDTWRGGAWKTLPTKGVAGRGCTLQT